jgi:hypothetical protein
MSTQIKNQISIRREENGSLAVSFYDGLTLSNSDIPPGNTWMPPTAWRKATVRADNNASVIIETDSSGEIVSIKNTGSAGPVIAAPETQSKIEIIKTLMDELPTDEDRLSLITQFCKHCGSTDPDCFCARDNFD